MKIVAVSFAAALALAAIPNAAEAKPGGCLKYGAGGAVAGHFAGGHRVKGALAGCALGIWQRRRYEAQQRERLQQQQRRRYDDGPPVARRRYDPEATGSFARRPGSDQGWQNDIRRRQAPGDIY